MMKTARMPLTPVCVLILAVFSLVTGQRAFAAVKTEGGCRGCHAGFASVLPPQHPPSQARTIADCLSCHPTPDLSKAAPNPFSARLHRGHEKGKAKVACTLCHSFTPGKRFGITGRKESWGKPSAREMKRIEALVRSWSSSSLLDGIHGERNVTCAGCHGKMLPEAGETVDDEGCLACHGSYEKLAEKTALPDSPKMNPHRSHMVGLPCTKCHRAHEPSVVYCLDCHKGFKMRIPGSGQAEKR